MFPKFSGRKSLHSYSSGSRRTSFRSSLIRNGIRRAGFYGSCLLTALPPTNSGVRSKVASKQVSRPTSCREFRCTVKSEMESSPANPYEITERCRVSGRVLRARIQPGSHPGRSDPKRSGGWRFSGRVPLTRNLDFGLLLVLSVAHSGKTVACPAS